MRATYCGGIKGGRTDEEGMAVTQGLRQVSRGVVKAHGHVFLRVGQEAQESFTL